MKVSGSWNSITNNNRVGFEYLELLPKGRGANLTLFQDFRVATCTLVKHPSYHHHLTVHIKMSTCTPSSSSSSSRTHRFAARLSSLSLSEHSIRRHTNVFKLQTFTSFPFESQTRRRHCIAWRAWEVVATQKKGRGQVLHVVHLDCTEHVRKYTNSELFSAL